MVKKFTIALVLAGLSLLGCAGSRGQHSVDNDLDLGSNAIVKIKQRSQSQSMRTAEVKGDVKVPPNAVTNWRSFFKAPPTVKERSVLEERLKHAHDSGDVDNLLGRARTELALGQLIAAETTFRQVLRHDDENIEALIELASLYLRIKRLNDTFDLLSQAKDAINGADDVGQGVAMKYRYTLALAYLARGDREKGHRILSDLIGVDKTFAPAYATLGQSYLNSGRDSVAEFVIRRGLDRVHDSASLLNLMGVLAERQKRVDEARTWFDKALHATPTYAPALVNRAVLSTQTLEYAAAEQDLLQALALDPLNVEALVALGVVQKRQGNISGAKASFTKAIEVGPEDPYARFNLAVLQADELQRPTEAARLFREVIQMNGATESLKDLARAYVTDLQPPAAR
ncbi:MAG: tetratricopeptide repeat protein [Deltaproteobacteria bacterium]|nr:tetratricopeptide repeat protein [Deltaproteobacteria bacterium]